MDLSQLNDKQKEAVTYTEGPLLVLAGAGSGKTRVLTTKVIYLIEKMDVNPFNILALTFTNKAANEMKMRIQNNLSFDAASMWVGTFHSICARILRRHIDILGYDNNFTIYDTNDQKSLIKNIIKENDYSDAIEYKNAYSIISSLKNQSISYEMYRDMNTLDYNKELIYKIYKKYENLKREYNALDFDDLIKKTIDIFKIDKDILSLYNEKFQYIFVDEYQDTNKDQYMLIKLLAGDNQNICVVGDPDQSIYGFRGARINNILDFEKDFEKAKLIKLEQNYRSTKNILDLANKLISNNLMRKEKNLWSANNPGEEVKYLESYNDKQEALFVCDKIEEMINKKRRCRDIAILYRMNFLSRNFEEELLRRNINYKVIGGVGFYDRKEIKDIVSYLKVLVNKKDDIALRRIINTPSRKIGDKAIEEMAKLSSSLNISIMEMLLDEDSLTKLSKRVYKLALTFINPLKELACNFENYSITEFIEEVIEKSGYMSSLNSLSVKEDEMRAENIQEFINSSYEYEKNNPDLTIKDYLENLSLLSDHDKSEQKDDAVSLMTVHSAKGLEFDVCFLVGSNEGIFPSSRSIDENNVEEERRLFYVAITRAKELLYITSSRYRNTYGQFSVNKRSRFVKEVETLLNELKDPADSFTTDYSYKKEKFIKDDYKFNMMIKKPSVKTKLSESSFKAGEKVRHSKWGIGTIVAVKESKNGNELTVAFTNKGIKVLNQNYAPIERV